MKPCTFQQILVRVVIERNEQADFLAKETICYPTYPIPNQLHSRMQMQTLCPYTKKIPNTYAEL